MADDTAAAVAVDGPATTSKLRDLKECRPIPIRKSLVLVNHFMVSTVRFMNRFCTLCEEKLSKVSHDVTRIETALAILEAKMNSIPDLDGVVGPEPVAADANAGAAAGASLGGRVCGEGGGGGCVCVRFPRGKKKIGGGANGEERSRGKGGAEVQERTGVWVLRSPPHPPPAHSITRASMDRRVNDSGKSTDRDPKSGSETRRPRRSTRRGPCVGIEQMCGRTRACIAHMDTCG